MDTVSSEMAALLRGMTEASREVERDFTEVRLNYDLSVPDEEGEVLISGSCLDFDPSDGGKLTFSALTFTLPHLPVNGTDFLSEIRLYLRLTLREDGFTLTAAIEIDLLRPVFEYPAGEHTVMRVTEDLTTVDETIAAAQRAVRAFAQHYSLFDDIGFPRRQWA
ncbi:hypothetical protein AB0F59_32385 [Micromonospora lupini]|uniref:hypothetical protein n=1 Tax=Micromonospora lupini TaxID=285679 RepID=UPI0033FBC23D